MSTARPHQAGAQVDHDWYCRTDEVRSSAAANSASASSLALSSLHYQFKLLRCAAAERGMVVRHDNTQLQACHLAGGDSSVVTGTLPAVVGKVA